MQGYAALFHHENEDAVKKLLLSLSVLCLMHEWSIAQQPGSVLWTRLTNEDSINSIKVQSDGKLVAAGNSYQGLYKVIAIGRFDEDMPDLSFGNNGIVTTFIDSAHTTANAVVIQQDGKIVVAGGYKKGTVGDFILARYKADGSTDSSFGLNGIVLTDLGWYDVATALAIRPDGRIVAAGRSGSSLALCRYNTDGSPDSSFDSDGKLTVASAGATCMMLQANGKIVVGCGNSATRLNPDGGLDFGFGTNAIAALTSYSYGIAIQNDGKILFSGGNIQFVLERLDTAGVHDNSFGNGGVVTANGFIQGSSSSAAGATSVCLQADGRMLAAGWARYGNGGLNRCFAVARFQTNGASDSSFGNFGKVADPVVPAYGWAASLSAAINNNNELVAAGMSDFGSKWALVGYYLGPLLSIPTAPSVDGQITVAPNPAEDFARIQSTHIGNGTWHLSLCDFTGKTLYSEKVVVTNNALDKSISLIGLPAAMYLVKLDNGFSRMTVKLMRNK